MRALHNINPIGEPDYTLSIYFFSGDVWVEYHFRGNRSLSPDEKVLTNFHESVPHPHLRSLILIQIHWTFDDDSDVS